MRRIITLLLILSITGSAYANEVKQLLISIRQRFDDIQDYECIMEDTQTKDGKSEHYIYNFYYKRPEKIRMDIIGGDNNMGTVLIYKDDRVKVKPGKGLLSLFSFSLKPDDKRIMGLNGFTVKESAGDYFLDQHIKNLDSFKGSILREEDLNGTKTILIELISKDLEETSSIARELIWVDKEELLLLKFIFYDEDGGIMQETEYINLKLGVGLIDKLFKKPGYKRE